LEDAVRTYQAKPGEVTREWLVLDATDVPLGRLASRAAALLRGKHKPQFTLHVDTGDYVIVVNASKLKLTGNKLQDKKKYRYSGYPGGLKATPVSKLMAERPERVVEDAVKGMLPKTTLGRAMRKKLKVYAGPDHPHAAQNPRPIELEA
jgi:large subunit ribosomal protein L13